MEIQQSLFRFLLWVLTAVASSNGSSTLLSSSRSPKRIPSPNYYSSSSSSSSNDVYPRTQNDTLEYLMVNEMLTEDDRSYDVKVLPFGREASMYMLKGETKRLVFPLLEDGPLTVIITPCASPLAWTVSLRPRYPQDIKIYEKLHLSKSVYSTNRTEPRSYLTPFYDNYEKIISRKRISRKNNNKLLKRTRDLTQFLHSVSDGNGTQESHIKIDTFDVSQVGSPIHSDSVSSSEHSSYRKPTENQRKVRDFRTINLGIKELEDIRKAQDDDDVDFDDVNSISDIFFDSDADIRGELPLSDAWTSDFETRSGNFRNPKDIILKSYYGYEAIIFHRQTVPAGLYIMQIKALSGPTYVHLQVKKEWLPPPATAHVSAVRALKPKGIILRWASSVTGGGYCLVVSEGRSYPSLCAARAAREAISQSFMPEKVKPWLQSFREGSNLKHPMLLLGCTGHNWFRLSNQPSRTLHVAVWESGKGGGPPMGRGVVRPSKRAIIPRLRPGELMTLVPSAGGRAAVKFKVRRRGRRLHVIGVSCGAELRLRVDTRHGRRLASATGEQGALHMTLRDLPPATITLLFRTIPPGASNTILATAAHATRTLSLPRLPRNVKVRAINITCSTAIIKWSKAAGNSSYCVLVEEVNSSLVWRERPPRQCGWEKLLEKTGQYVDLWCGPPTKSRRQAYTTDKLFANTNYIATVLVQHNVTGRTLALPPVRFSASNCKNL